MAFSEEYYVSAQGAQKGPYSFQQIRRLRDKGFISDETKYWRDGMEQWEPVVDLCGPSKKARRKMGRRRWTVAAILGAVLVAVVCVFAPPLLDAWREINQHEPNAKAAYWKARGFVRAEMHRRNTTVTFDGFAPNLVTMTWPGDADITLSARLFEGAGERRAVWQVALHFDEPQREWHLVSLRLLEASPRSP